MRTGTLLLLAGLWLAGCDNSLYDQMTSGAGCHGEDRGAGVIGTCPGDQLACAPGTFDRDGVASNGCESSLQASSDYSPYALASTGIAVVTINEYPLQIRMTGGWVAVASPHCDATPATPCQSELLALQVTLGDFIFDSLPMSDGLLELSKPIPVTDSGNGPLFAEDTTFTISFVVDGKKRIVSQGKTRGHWTVGANGTTVSLEIEDGLHAPLGGYTLESLYVLAVGNSTASP